MMVHDSDSGNTWQDQHQFCALLVVRYAPQELWWKNELRSGRPFITFNPMKDGLLLLGLPLLPPCSPGASRGSLTRYTAMTPLVREA